MAQQVVARQQTLSLAEARAAVLGAQGLQQAAFGRGKAGTLRAIEHLGYVQIDTISAVERAHHHVLWTRVPGYKQRFLHELQAEERKVFEYWSHAAAYLPLSDYRYCLPRMRAFTAGERHWFERDRRMMQHVLDRITAEGPLQTRDFETPAGGAGPWYDWKPAKRALEQLFQEGRLMVRERKGFQKVYDLTERVLPARVDTSAPSAEEMGRFLVQRTLRAHGLATAQEICYLKQGKLAQVQPVLAEMEAAGEVVRVRVAELDGPDYFALPGSLEQAATGGRRGLHILSPFDNTVIQRKRLKRLFGFDYQIECYVPAPKRQYGYFCLPLLWQERMIGRLDATADRRQGILQVHSLHLESGHRNRGALREALEEQLQRFAAFNGCQECRLPS